MNVLRYLAAQSIDFEHIWWMFFNKVSCTLHYIYACFFRRNNKMYF